MLIRFADGRATAIDYREVAPGRAHRDMYLDEKGNPVAERSLVGPLAAGVPGSVAGLAYAQKKYGKLTLAETLAPAIALADKGFEISYALSRSLADQRKLFDRFPETAKIFFKNGRPYEPGERLIQKDLAGTLKAIAADGPDAFYRGPRRGPDCRRDGPVGRPHHERRSRRVQTRRARSARERRTAATASWACLRSAPAASP